MTTEPIQPDPGAARRETIAAAVLAEARALGGPFALPGLPTQAGIPIHAAPGARLALGRLLRPCGYSYGVEVRGDNSWLDATAEAMVLALGGLECCNLRAHRVGPRVVIARSGSPGTMLVLAGTDGNNAMLGLIEDGIVRFDHGAGSGIHANDFYWGFIVSSRPNGKGTRVGGAWIGHGSRTGNWIVSVIGDHPTSRPAMFTGALTTEGIRARVMDEFPDESAPIYLYDLDWDLVRSGKAW